MKIYMIRDNSTGKFVSNITNPGHKYWESRNRAEDAIERYDPKRLSMDFTCRNGVVDKRNLEIIEFMLVESIKE